MTYDTARALALLRLGSGLPHATFRDGQEDAIRQIVTAPRRLLVVQKTGWGKSFVYFIATKLLREAGHGPAILISPLLALMRNQLIAAERMGVRAFTINSDNVGDWESAEEAVARDDIDILIVSPERLANARFRDRVLSLVGARISLMVIDEAHCISDWGHDFRPHYRLVERTLRALPRNVRVLATTATANDRVVADLENVLGPDLSISRGDLQRPSLLLQTIRLSSQAERLAWLAERVPLLPGSGIIYTLTKRDAETVAAWLRSRGLEVEAYTGDSGDRRVELEAALLANGVKALVATTALGMGYDKPDLHFVIHYQTPGSVVAYYQQVGRAGRGVDAAYGVLLSGSEDTDITDWFIDSAFPTREEAAAILAALEEAPAGRSLPQLQQAVNVSYTRIEKTLQLLSLESPAPIVKQGPKWRLTAAELGETFWSRAERLTEIRRSEQRQMQEYVALDTGHMEFLMRALDCEPRGVRPPQVEALSTAVDARLVREAETFLRRTHLTIEPRQKWPGGGLPEARVSGNIAVGLQASEGRALCIWGDAGWGGLVQRGKHQDGNFSDELVTACAEMYLAWRPQPPPEWVTSIPSPRRPDLVPDFARRLAAALKLPYHDILESSGGRPEQKTMANSSQQASNIDGALRLADSVKKGPVLLIDDMADSRWTLTVAAWLLRSNGSGPVHPLVLAVV